MPPFYYIKSRKKKEVEVPEGHAQTMDGLSFLCSCASFPKHGGPGNLKWCWLYSALSGVCVVHMVGLWKLYWGCGSIFKNPIVTFLLL